MKIRTMLDRDMRNHVMRNNKTGEIKIIRCDDAITAYDFCENHYKWSDVSRIYMTDEDSHEPDEIIYTERLA